MSVVAVEKSRGCSRQKQRDACRSADLRAVSLSLNVGSPFFMQTVVSLESCPFLSFQKDWTLAPMRRATTAHATRRKAKVSLTLRSAFIREHVLMRLNHII